MERKHISKRSYVNTKKFAKEYVDLWSEMDKFVEKYTEGKKEDEQKEFIDNLCTIVDKYCIVNCRVRDWCQKNNVNINEFICDVMNARKP